MLSPAELTLLSRLDLAFRRPVSGLYAGERRSPRSARSPEFADFRPYVAGDDFRQIDWRAFARLERLMLKLYVAEEESSLNVVLDASASMELGSPAKWHAARRLAAALAFIGLSSMDRVAVGSLGDRNSHTAHLRGKDGVARIWSYLEASPSGGAAPASRLSELAWLRPGLTVVISDFLGEEGGEEGSGGEPWPRAVFGLRRRRQEPLLWQLLSPDEENPTLSGDWRLVIAESEQASELTITPGLVAEYRARLAQHRSSIRRAAEGAGGRLVVSLSAHSLEEQMAAGMACGAIRR